MSARTVRVLVVSDEVDERLAMDVSPVRGVEAVLACGDLPFDYLGRLADALDVPLVFVPGNHDPDVAGYRTARSGLTTRAGLPAQPPWPPGAVNVDGTVADVAGLRIAGLGGCLRYTPGPNQYTERQQAARARRLARRVRRRTRDGRAVDVLLTHAPPLGVGDRPDPPHTGFACLHRLTRRTGVPLLLHGHVHPHGAATPNRFLGATLVRNVVGRHVMELAVGESGCATDGISPG